MTTKQTILSNLGYTELVYGRINKKLHLSLSKTQIEVLIVRCIQDTAEQFFVKQGKNFYITNTKSQLRITINSSSGRVITVDPL